MIGFPMIRILYLSHIAFRERVDIRQRQTRTICRKFTTGAHSRCLKLLGMMSCSTACGAGMVE